MIEFSFPPKVEAVRLQVRKLMDQEVRPKREAIDLPSTRVTGRRLSKPWGGQFQ